MKRLLIIGGLIIASTITPVKVLAATFSKLIVYGDSYSDLGNGADKGIPVPSGYYDKRFSNGPLWVEYLATSLGITTDPRLTNFAEGGATTGAINNGQGAWPSLIGIKTQVAIHEIKDPNALYIIWGGANDYVGATPTNPLNIDKTIANLTDEIGTLITRDDAKNILVVNLPNLGQLPHILQQPPDVSIMLDAVTASHNAKLATNINTLSQNNLGVKLNLLDVNSLFSTATSAGFTNVTDGCIYSPNCTPDTYLFWDEAHPTTAGHRLLGDLAFRVVSPTAVPEPMTMLGSLAAASSAIAFKRRLKSSSLKVKEIVKNS